MLLRRNQRSDKKDDWNLIYRQLGLKVDDQQCRQLIIKINIRQHGFKVDGQQCRQLIIKINIQQHSIKVDIQQYRQRCKINLIQYSDQINIWQHICQICFRKHICQIDFRHYSQPADKRRHELISFAFRLDFGDTSFIISSIIF